MANRHIIKRCGLRKACDVAEASRLLSAVGNRRSLASGGLLFLKPYVLGEDAESIKRKSPRLKPGVSERATYCVLKVRRKG